MKKLSLFKKMMLIASTAFMASSLVFIPFIQNKEVKFNKNKNFTAKTVILKNESRDIKYICQTMEFNEKWLEVTDVQRISGKTDKFTEIDFSDLTVEGDSSDYELKSIKIPEATLDKIFDKPNLRYLNMSEYKWIHTPEYFFKNINLPNEIVDINLSEKLFEKNVVNNKNEPNGFGFIIRDIIVKELNFNVEQNVRNTYLVGWTAKNVIAEKLVFKGTRMGIVYELSSNPAGKFINSCKIDKIIFENSIIAYNLCCIENLTSRNTKLPANVIFKDAAKNMPLWSSDEEKGFDRGLFVDENSYYEIIFSNPSTTLNFLKIGPENQKTDWFWNLNDIEGKNKITLSILNETYLDIMNNDSKKERWNEAKRWGEIRNKNSNDVPWFKNNFEPHEITSTLVSPIQNTINEGDTLEFNLTFVGNEGYYINKDNIKLFAKKSGESSDKIVDKYHYSIVINSAIDDPNKKIAKVTFLLPRNYNKLIFNYITEKETIIRDSSEGVDIEVRAIVPELYLSTDYDINQKLSKGQSILFMLDFTKKFNLDEKNKGVIFFLKDLGGNRVIFDDYLYVEWIEEKITDRHLEFKIISKNEQLEEKTLLLEILSSEYISAKTQNVIINLFDEPRSDNGSVNNTVIIGASAGGVPYFV